MSIHIHVTQELRVDNLKALQDKVQLRGGRLIAYAEVLSAFFITARSYKVKWIATVDERMNAGIFSTIVTALFGWWSLAGPYWTITAILWNRRGGFDVTDALLRAHPGNTTLLGYSDAIALKQSHESVSQLSRRVCLGLVVILVGTIAFLVWNVSKK